MVTGGKMSTPPQDENVAKLVAAGEAQQPAEQKAKKASARVADKGRLSDTPAMLRKLFGMFNISKSGHIEVAELRAVMKAMGLFPSVEELKTILREVSHNHRGTVTYDDFVRMRKENQKVDLNVLAEFKKFDISRLHRGFISVDCLAKVLDQEGVNKSDSEEFMERFMLADSDHDGKVSFHDLYEKMMERIPDEWLDWVFQNVQRGVHDNDILRILCEHGFDVEVAKHLLLSTKTQGRQHLATTYADKCRAYVYTMRA